MTVIMDVGHNHQALGEFLRTLGHQAADEDIVFAFGTSRKKDAGPMVRQLQQFVRERGRGAIFLINGDNPRSKPVCEIEQELGESREFVRVEAQGRIKATLEQIVRDEANRGKVGVTSGWRSAGRSSSWRSRGTFSSWARRETSTS